MTKGDPAMSDRLANLPAPLEAEGVWKNVFSYHPMDVELARAEGVHLFDTKGNRYIDASGGPMAVNLGHNDPRMRAAVEAQMRDFAYVHPVLANRPRAALCNAIAEVAPEGLNATYLVSGGSEAVETAVKIARQYWVGAGKPEKHKVIACYESYHGMTLGTMALSGNAATMRPFDPMLQKWPHARQYSDHLKPAHLDRDEWAVECARDLERLIHCEGAHSVAAFIVTPHGCGSEYGVVAPARYWEEVRRICDEYEVLLIADEVVTGFGRTGEWFGMQHFGVAPDIMTMAKGISSCFLPLGAVTVSDAINEVFRAGTPFIHGFTNGGNALSCAAGLQVIDIIKEDGLIAHCRKMGERLFAQKERLLAHPTVADARGWGLFMVLEMVESKASREYFAPEKQAEQLFQSLALKNGLVFYSTLYGARRRPLFRRGLPLWVSPPLTISASEIDELVERLDRTLGEWERMLGVAGA